MSHSVAYTIGKEPYGYNQGSRENSPGPGAYDPTLLSSSPQFTYSQFHVISNRIGTKYKDLKHQNNPGPGFYESQASLLNKSPQHQFGSKSKRDLSQNRNQSMYEICKSPGPGAYSPKQNASKYKNPTFGFGKGERGISSRDLSPGPGAYAREKEFGEGARKAVINGRPMTAKGSDNPGPGQYEAILQSAFGGHKSYNGVTSMRNKGERIQSPSRDVISKPGPGAYEANSNVVRERTPDFRFGTSQRDGLVSRDEKLKPGPGQYEVKNLKSARGVKIGEKIQQSFQNKTPGPGNYDPNPNYNKASVRGVKIQKQMNKTVLAHSKSTSLVGPGLYNLDSGFGKNAQKVTIKGKPKQDKPKDIPGPGYYDPNENLSKERIQSAVLKNQEKRFKDSHFRTNELSPGPGNYYNQNEFGKSSKSFTIQGKSEQKNRDQKPGPGAYEVKDSIIKSFTPSYKQGQSKRQDLVSKQVREMPGPGQYNSASHKVIGKDVHTYTMGTKKVYQERELSPGPGAYAPDHNIVKDKVKYFNMGTSRRPDIAPKTARDMPGPGMYEQPSKKGGPQYSIITKRAETKYKDTPGPGAYDAMDTINRDKSPSYRLGTGSRTQIISKSIVDQPGPGQYDSPTKIGKGPKYSFQARNEPKLRDNRPGPGNYDPDSHFVKDKVITYKMGSSTRQQLVSREFQEKPGPGQYDSHQKISHGPTYTMGGRSRSRQDLSPGPGQYDPSHEVIKDNILSYKMSKTSRGSILNKSMAELPGPGQYTNQEQFGQSAQKVSIRGKPDDKNRNDIPGPGQYDQSDTLTKCKSVAYKIDSKSKRSEIVTKEMLLQPGPGEYDSPIRIGKDSYGAIIRGKPEENLRDESPGPGHYQPQSSATKDKVIAYQMSKSNRTDIISKEQKNQPGPGIYDQHSTIGRNTHSYSMSGKVQQSYDNKLPGPGAYEPNNHVVKDTVKSAAFSKTQRQSIVSKEELLKPGPGNYSNVEQFGKDTKSFQIRGRPKDQAGNDIPGPGNYDQNEHYNKDRVITYKMGTSTRDNIVSRERTQSPGPGQYDSPSKFGQDCYNYSIKGRVESPRKDEIPGPGHYDAADSATKYSSPSVKISGNKTQRCDYLSPEKLSQPGPGQYDQHSNIGKGQAIQIRGKPQEQKPSDIPGPGYYDAAHEVVKDKVPSVKISRSKRDYLKMSNDDLNHPGPGFYDQQTQLNTKSFKMGGKPTYQPKNEIPGPGQYEKQDQMTKYQIPSVDFSRSPDRSTSMSPRKDENPGPGQYDARDYNVNGLGMTITYSFSKGELKQDMSDTPGPGHYMLPSKFAELPSYQRVNSDEKFKYV